MSFSIRKNCSVRADSLVELRESFESSVEFFPQVLSFDLFCVSVSVSSLSKTTSCARLFCTRNGSEQAVRMFV